MLPIGAGSLSFVIQDSIERLAVKCLKCRRPLASVVILIITAASAWAQDWPQWRGPNRDDKVPGFTAPKTWPQQPNLKWKVTVGHADATPALVGGKLFVFARQDDYEVIQCLDAANGTTLWSNRYEVLAATGAAGSHPGPRSSPTVADGKVITLGVRGTLSCLEADSGKLLWRKDDIRGWPQFFTATSPLIADGFCIAQLGGKTNGVVAAYDLNSGDEKWKWSGDGAAYASPVVMMTGDTKLIITQTDKRLVALNLADGKLAWQTPYVGKGMGAGNYDTPIIDGQTLIYTGGGRGTIAVKLDKQGESFIATGLWTNMDNSPRFCTPVLKDGFLYGLSDPGNFYCIDARTGKTAWTEANGSRGGFGSILDAGSVLVALTPKSHLVVFQPNDKEYTEVASMKVADTPTYAQPLLSGNRLFVEDQDSVSLLTLD
jgi:outer membrane protein assembly factor BamB